MSIQQITFAAAALSLCAVGLLAAPGGDKKDRQVSLVRPDEPQDFDAKGTLRIRETSKGASFEVHALKIAEDHDVSLWIEDPAGSDSFTDVEPLVGGGSKKLMLDTGKGGELPLAAPSLDDLIGRAVRVQYGAVVMLEGIVPSWDLPAQPQKATVVIEPPDEAPADEMRGKLSLRSKAAKGQERIDLKLSKVPWEFVLVLRVFIEDGEDSGVFVDAGKIDKLGSKGGRWRVDTKLGESLPGGASYVSELGGRMIEVRRASDGEVFLRGVIPLVN